MKNLYCPMIHAGLNVNFITEKYYQNLNKGIKPVLDNTWQEIAAHIKRMIEYLDKFDKIRNLSWVKNISRSCRILF